MALFELAIVMFLASGLGILARLLKQPTVLAYLATGALIGYFGFFNVQDRETFRVFSDLGIMFLLFLIGLEVNYSSLLFVGKTALILGGAQVLATGTLGFFLASWLGFVSLEALYIAIALTFSSTVIVVKLLADKKDLHSLYGRLSVGLLLVQDFVAVLVLVALAGIGSGGFSWIEFLSAIIKGVLLFGAMFWLGRRFFPVVFDAISRSSELLFLTSLAWVLMLAAVVSRIGFSIEIAGFLAGIALANSSEHFEIAGKIRPLRDFFLVIFFVILGSSTPFFNIQGAWGAVVILSLFILVLKPLIVWLITALLGYRKRTFFLVGITTAQISEFSLIIASLGFRLGHIGESTLSIITASGIFTILISTYMIMYGEKIFWYSRRALSFMERTTSLVEPLEESTAKKSTILIGCHRVGQSIASHIPKHNLLIVDFDPEIVSSLRREGYSCIFGDIRDSEIFERAHIAEARLVISTSPDFEDNAALLEAIGHLRERPKVIVRAESEHEIAPLYQLGAHYVLLPHFTAGQYLGKAIATDPFMRTLDQLKARDIILVHKQAGALGVPPA